MNSSKTSECKDGVNKATKPVRGNENGTTRNKNGTTNTMEGMNRDE